MAGPAGLAAFHVFHGSLVRAALGLKQVRMAISAAAKHLNVNGVREYYVAGFFVLVENVAGMALGAVTGNGYSESIGPVMTGPAGLAALHVFHGCLVRALFGFKQVWMATVASPKRFNVDRVRE
jgi:hypothetical protein